MKTILILIITIIIGGIPSKEKVATIYTQNCSAELTVEKDRSFKSATENVAEFKLTLTNTSNSQTSYNLIVSKLLSSCSNKTSAKTFSKLTTKNSDLNVSFGTNSSNNISKNQSKLNNSITLNTGQSKEFIVKAMVPEGTPYNTWGCIKVEANSTNCGSASAEIILSIYIPDPSEG